MLELCWNQEKKFQREKKKSVWVWPSQQRMIWLKEEKKRQSHKAAPSFILLSNAVTVPHNYQNPPHALTLTSPKFKTLTLTIWISLNNPNTHTLSLRGEHEQ